MIALFVVAALFFGVGIHHDSDTLYLGTDYTFCAAQAQSNSLTFSCQSGA